MYLRILVLRRYSLNSVSSPLLIDCVRPMYHIPVKRRMVACVWHSLLIGSKATVAPTYFLYLYDSNNSTLLVPNKLLWCLEGVSYGALSNQFLTRNKIQTRQHHSNTGRERQANIPTSTQDPTHY